MRGIGEVLGHEGVLMIGISALIKRCPRELACSFPPSKDMKKAPSVNEEV
jgi:hypothetical protein